jgi:hypothetical protein
MSVVDDLRGLESRVAKRLKELRPLVEEYRELEQVAQRLGIGEGDRSAGESSATRDATASRRSTRSASERAGSTDSKRGRRRSSRSTTPRRTASASRAGNGRQQQVAELVKQRPGVTVRELGVELGVDPTSLYRVVRRLEQDGTIKKQGRQLQPV